MGRVSTPKVVRTYLGKVGRMGGKKTSRAKANAARRNARLGGRPRKS